MNRIETGNIFTAVRQRTGKSSGGDWELLLTQDERGHNDIALFVENRPSGVKEGGKFRVEKILSVSYGMKKDSNGEWRPAISVNAEVTAVESYEDFKASADAAEEEEDVCSGECPF